MALEFASFLPPSPTFIPKLLDALGAVGIGSCDYGCNLL